MLLEEVPHAAVAVEEVGVGYRINRPFPDGEITGEMRLETVEELVAEPVTRVIIRDPHSSEEEFLELAEKLGLHGTNYFIGWTAWLDIAPEGVSKASALAEVAAELGVAPGRRAGHRRRPQRHRDARAGPAAAWPWARRRWRSRRPPTTSPRPSRNDGVALELGRWF